ncbi:protein kinase [Mycolicibacterium arabiense]|uniref:non-specific serine/threonine protein kinase n=1 Tax=Mycolicibacterium arabiense TaxID=1286181 RepID=A0A7I7RZA4_9MYCO|nr:serine/threonine-protein kinase [Mycolicibacterium arabiense]MCV7374275.1 serine/threonine protein kinase [Mycolicibacterium arabiense]BBY49530.1 protein kinase [Mycolicibacterium arabiense]
MDGPGLLGGRYELRDILGFGGMAEVRDGWDTRLDRAVAVKLLYPGLSSQPETRERFTVEARSAAALNHPDIVSIFDFGDDDESPFIVMERLPGETLGDRIELGQLSSAEVREVLCSVLSALSAAHAAGMLHRDVKPGNVLLTSSGGVKLADFGIAKTPGGAHTTTGQIVGTLAYLSPERIASKPASIADDLYAVGVVGYEALTGEKPFQQDEIMPLARAILEEDPVPLTTLRPDVDPDLAAVIERAMSRDPQRRFATADDMRDALTGGAARRFTPARPVAFAAPVSQPPVSAPSTGSTSRPITRVFDAPTDTFPAVSTSAVDDGHRAGRGRAVAVASAVLCSMAALVVVFGLDRSPTSTPSDTEPVSISTPAAPPPAPPPPAPLTVTQLAPAPVVEPQAPAPAPVIEQATQQKERGGNNGNGKGNGNGTKKPK